MKKLIYSICIGVATLGLTSCSGQEDYDAYITDLKAQHAVIDTISSPASYANYLDQLAVKADNFSQIGLKLNANQKEEIATISQEIQNALDNKYQALAQTPMALPDDFVILEADAPVENFTRTNATPELQ